MINLINKIRGVVISETPYGETSKIINIITENHGILGIMCKGAKGMKSKLRAVTTRFTYGNFHMYYKEDKLSTLIAVDVIDNLTNLKTDITLLGYLTYITDLTRQVMKQNPSSEIFNLFITTVLKVNENQNPQVMTNILELKLLEFLGVGLNLDSCIKCGNKTNIITIDADQGGYICKGCHTNQSIVNVKTVKMLRMYCYVEIDSITKIDINETISREINNFLNKYYERYTGLYLYSKTFLESVR